MKQLLLALFLLPLYVNGQVDYELGTNFDSGTYMASFITNLQWEEFITIDTAHFSHNVWQVGKPDKAVFDSAYSYRNVIITDTMIPVPPNDTSVFIFKLKDSTLDIYGEYGYFSGMNFYYQLDKDTASIAMIEFSPDSGNTWINVYDTSAAYYFDSVTPLVNTIVWSSWYLQLSWTAWSVGMLNPNDSFMFRFTYISSNDTASYPGWMIDDIWLWYQGPEKTPLIHPTSLITLFPNPAHDELSVQSTGSPINSVVITNMLGQAVYSWQYAGGSMQAQIDISGLPDGVYFVKMSVGSALDDSHTIVRKFVKE